MTYGWRGTFADLRESIRSGRFLEEISSNYRAYFGHINESEYRSWSKSVPALVRTLDDPVFDRLLVIVELQMPVGGERADVVLLGGTPVAPKGMVIELKQWSSITADHLSNLIDVPGFGLHRHPSVQALNYAGKLHFFNARAHVYELSAAALLHNAAASDMAELIEKVPPDWTTAAPVFWTGSQMQLGKFVEEKLLPGYLEFSEVVNFSEAPYAQSQHLFSFVSEHAQQIAMDAEVALAGTGLGLTEDQARVKSEIVKALLGGESKDFIIQGNPGSGKTLLAVSLLLRSLELGKSTILAIRNNRLQAILRQVLDRAYPGASGCMMYFETQSGTGIAQRPQSVDLIICDEAQRMRMDNPRNILGKARVCAVFLDETQRLNPPEQGTVQNVANASEQLGRTPHIRRLDTVVRCQGGQAYHQWVELLLDQPGEFGALQLNNQEWGRNYEIAIHRQALDLISALSRWRNAQTRVALVASFTESPGNKRTMDPNNLRIGYPLTSGFSLYKGLGVKVPWLMTAPDYQSFWYGGTSSRLDRVASIYGAQGFESDYVGVFWGRDFVYRSGRWTTGDPEWCYDSIDQLISRKAGQKQWNAEALVLLKNRYRIFLTRGIKGTHIYCEDDETREYLCSLA